MARWRDIGYWMLKVPRQKLPLQKKGTLKGGIETTDTVTYWSIPRVGGAYYAEGKGVLMIREDVNELATWTGQGIAYYSGSKRRDVGSVFCRAGSTTGLLAFLNNMVGVFEYEVDENGNSGGKIWEWK